MKKMMSRSPLAAILVLALCSGPAAACNIPVFRYALDHWAADPYRLTLFHRGPLDDRTKDAITAIEKKIDLDFPSAALEVVDLDTLPRKPKGVPLPPDGAELPWLVVEYPSISRIDAAVWSGPLKDLSVPALFDSPARAETVRRLRGGDSAVWLLLTSGNAEKDDAAEKLLAAELKRLEKELKLPKRTASPEDQLIDEEGRPLRLAFTVLRVDRSAAAESLFVKMLLNTEVDLPGRMDPMVFPVFGRGRALPALIGNGITVDNIEESAAFLVGPCSCQVKRDNPGVDLLLTATWHSPVSAEPAPIGLPAIEGGSIVPLPQAKTAVIPAAPAASAIAASQPAVADVPTQSWPRYALFAGIGVTGLVVLLTGMKLLLRTREAVDAD